jgi:multicomponent Na+:H+ antiporter subunit D
MQKIQYQFGKSPIAKYHLSESWPTGSMVFWISAILAAFLVLDLFGLGG